MLRSLLALLFALCLAMPVKAQQDTTATTAPASASATDRQLQVSLLTCSPGEKVYELYGHTALRVRSLKEGGMDWVFNYGSFSFEQPHFVWRFVKGDTDYQLAVLPFCLFYDAYARDGRAIYEQVINFTPAEANRLEDALANNLQPDSCTYRYNFFFDNCVTRAIAQIERAVEGKVVWPATGEATTLRTIVHEYSAASPWDRFGQDLLLGAEADRPATLREQMFAPIYAEQFVERAKIVRNNGEEVRLAQPMQIILQAKAAEKASQPFTPMVLMVMLAIVAASCLVYTWRKGKHVWAFPAALMGAQGLAGCIVSFLFFFSSHPTVGTNWLIIALNPLPLLYLPWYMKHASLGRCDKGALLNAALIALTCLVGLFGLQSIPAELYAFFGITLAMMLTELKKKRTDA